MLQGSSTGFGWMMGIVFHIIRCLVHFIPESLLCGFQELRHVPGHVHLVITGSAVQKARLSDVGALRKEHANPSLLYQISVAALLDRACRMPMFRSKFGSGTPPVLPRPSSSVECLVEACGIQNIDGAVDREPAPLEQCRVLHAFGWKNIISGGKDGRVDRERFIQNPKEPAQAKGPAYILIGVCQP
jgi:hypothetical protein